jgi:hypothetical protein
MKNIKLSLVICISAVSALASITTWGTPAGLAWLIATTGWMTHCFDD